MCMSLDGIESQFELAVRAEIWFSEIFNEYLDLLRRYSSDWRGFVYLEPVRHMTDGLRINPKCLLWNTSGEFHQIGGTSWSDQLV